MSITIMSERGFFFPQQFLYFLPLPQLRRFWMNSLLRKSPPDDRLGNGKRDRALGHFVPAQHLFSISCSTIAAQVQLSAQDVNDWVGARKLVSCGKTYGISGVPYLALGELEKVLRHAVPDRLSNNPAMILQQPDLLGLVLKDQFSTWLFPISPTGGTQQFLAARSLTI